ncbi:MAG: GTP-binding protein [Bacteroidota bacterium]
MTDLILVSGFLGSGKTTLLKRLLQANTDKRVAVIQNEFAPSGVDGKELQLSGQAFKLVEINNGSVFCVCLLHTFLERLDELIENYRPEIIYLEASGISDPISICELLNQDSIRNKVRYGGAWCVVDALHFKKAAAFVNRAKHQVRVADTIILNKMDLVDEKQLGEVLQQIKTINPVANIKTATFCDVQDTQPHFRPKDLPSSFEDRPPEEIKAAVYRTTAIIDLEQLKEFLVALAKVSIRAKGFVRVAKNKYVLFHLAFNDFDILPLKGYSGSCEIIAFGELMHVKLLRQLFQKAKEPVA